MRRLLGLRAKSKVLIEERDGGIFISPVSRKRSITPIDYLPAGAIKLSASDYALDRLAGEDDIPAS
jgi:bifunctional DNA-binding transcriptional regulator/antitoxin component of YhaV-PrlF toxin-antitoxin module